MKQTEPEAPGLGELLSQLVEDGKGVARAEIGYYLALLRVKLRQVRAGLILAGIAIALVLGATIALVVGLVLTLAPLVGPGFATLIVVVASGGVAALLGWRASVHIRRALQDRT